MFLSVFNGELLVTTECLIQLHYKDPPLDSLFTFNIVHITCVHLNIVSAGILHTNTPPERERKRD